jgi:hypothetical protein
MGIIDIMIKYLGPIIQNVQEKLLNKVIYDLYIWIKYVSQKYKKIHYICSIYLKIRLGLELILATNTYNNKCYEEVPFNFYGSLILFIL